MKGNYLYHQEKYGEAIETYKAAIKISKKSIYEESKINAEKKYKEQKQSLKLKQKTLVTNEDNLVEVKDSAQENLRDELAIFQKIITQTTTKIESNTAVSAKDRDVMQSSINEITRTVQALTNKTDINTIIKSMEVFVSEKITEKRIAVVEEDLSGIIERQIKLDESIRTEKLAIFQKVVADITTELESNTTISLQDKDVMQTSIKEIVDKVQRLNNKTDIEKITESTKDIVSIKITNTRLGVIEEDVNQLIEQQSKPSHNVIVNKVEEIIYNNPLLNHL